MFHNLLSSMKRVQTVAFSVLISCGTGGCGTTGSGNPVPVPPSITTQPQSQTVTVGQTATFTVVASGTAPLHYQWIRDATNVGTDSSSYSTPAVVLDDNGAVFSVVVTNIAGTITSNQATLTATVAPNVVGPRQPVGPDVPLTAAEQAACANSVSVAGFTSSAVIAAIGTAVSDGIPCVYLPSGTYVFTSSVSVPGNLTVFGAGSGTTVQVSDSSMYLFVTNGNHIRFTRMKLKGYSEDWDTAQTDGKGIHASGATQTDIRVDHLEASGFGNGAVSAEYEATVQVDHSYIHHNLFNDRGYGVLITSGAYVSVTDNNFSQNRHSVASNGAVVWACPRTIDPKYRKTHFEVKFNHIYDDSLTQYYVQAIDTHQGMDGTFRVYNNLFEDLSIGIWNRDGSGLIDDNQFNRTKDAWSNTGAMTFQMVGQGDSCDMPVSSRIPHDITVTNNRFTNSAAGVEETFAHPTLSANINIDGTVYNSNPNFSAVPVIRFTDMGEDGILRWND